MKVKVTIKKNTKAAKVAREYMAEKEAFRKAAETGKAVDYAKTKPQKFEAAISPVLS